MGVPLLSSQKRSFTMVASSAMLGEPPAFDEPLVPVFDHPPVFVVPALPGDPPAGVLSPAAPESAPALPPASGALPAALVGLAPAEPLDAPPGEASKPPAEAACGSVLWE